MACPEIDVDDVKPNTRTRPVPTQVQPEEHGQTTWNVLAAECQKRAEELSFLAEEIAKIPNTLYNKPPIKGDVRNATHDSSNSKIQSLQAKLKDFQHLDTSHRKRILDLEEQLKRARTDILESERKQEILRQIILGDLGDQQPSDAELIHLYADIRQQTQRLAHNKIYVLDQVNPSELEALSPDDREFYSTLMHTPRNYKVRLRAKIHEILHENILNVQYFGISGSDQWKLEPEWNPQTPLRIEQSFRQFEQLMVNQGVSDNEILGWRIATLKCINLSEFKGDLERGLADYMMNFFQPLIPATVDSHIRAKMQLDFARLCGDACKLRLLMRESKEGYSCQMLPAGVSFHEHEYLADDVGTEGDGGEAERVAFTISGALIQQAKYGGEQLMVLKKAQVFLGAR